MHRRSNAGGILSTGRQDPTPRPDDRADRPSARRRRPPQPRGRRPRPPPVAIRAHGRLPARVRGRPADLSGRHEGRLRAHLDGHLEGPQALRAVDRGFGRLRPSSSGRRRLSPLVPGRHPPRVCRGRPDPPALDGHGRDGGADATDRVPRRTALVSGRHAHRLQHARAAPAAQPGRGAETALRRRMGAAADHGESLQEQAGRCRIPRLRIPPRFRGPRRGRDADPGDLGRLPALRRGRLGARRHPPRLLVEPQPGLGARPPQLGAVRGVGPRRRDPRADRPAPAPITARRSRPTAAASPSSATRTAPAPTRSAGSR